MAATEPRAGAGPGRALAAVVLAAGEGRRLRPLTLRRPKPLCPVGDRALVDLALDRVAPVTTSIAVNVHHHRAQLEAHLAERASGEGPSAAPVHLSVEADRALGTAGALGLLRPWIDGRGTLVVNADAWCRPDLVSFVAGWDGERIRLLVAGRDGFDAGADVAAALMPWSEVARFRPEPTGLYESSWRAAHEEGRLEVVRYDGPFVDCGTPARYLAANLAAAELAGGSIVGPGALIDGEVESSVVGRDAVVSGQVRHSVVWDHAVVRPTERLDHAIRAGAHLTVLLR